MVVEMYKIVRRKFVFLRYYLGVVFRINRTELVYFFEKGGWSSCCWNLNLGFRETRNLRLDFWVVNL